MCAALSSTFEEAIRLEPAYVATVLRSGDVLLRERGVWGAAGSIGTSRGRRIWSTKGLALDANSVTLHSVLGMLRMFEWRWAESEKAHLRAMSLEPAQCVCPYDVPYSLQLPRPA